jgi:hypothetical protein
VTTTYLSTVALDRIEAAQETFERHVVSSQNGRCVECLAEGPCRERIQALRLMAAYGSLPRRRPGASQPELAAFGQQVWPRRYDYLLQPDEPADLPVRGPVAVRPRAVMPLADAPAQTEPVIIQPRRPTPGLETPDLETSGRSAAILPAARRPTSGRHARRPG